MKQQRCIKLIKITRRAASRRIIIDIDCERVTRSPPPPEAQEARLIVNEASRNLTRLIENTLNKRH